MSVQITKFAFINGLRLCLLCRTERSGQWFGKAAAGAPCRSARLAWATSLRYDLTHRSTAAVGAPGVKILQTRGAPNPRRVRIFLAEKGIEVPFEEIDLMKGELKTAEFTQMNRFQRVPVLLLDDGTVICRNHGDLPLFRRNQAGAGAVRHGRRCSGPWSRCGTGAWSLNLLFCVAQVFRHLHPAMAHLEVPQVAAWGEANRPRVLEILQFLDEELGTRRYIAGDALLGCRYYGIGCHRFHEAGANSTAGRFEESCALACGGVGAA